MAKLLGDEAYRAARKQTTDKLAPMRDAFISLAKKGSGMVTDRDLDKSEAEIVANTLKTIGVDATLKHSGGRWVVVGTLDDLSDYCLATRRDYDVLMFRLNNAGLNAIYDIKKIQRG